MRQLDPQGTSERITVFANMGAKNEDGTTKPLLLVKGDRKDEWIFLPAGFTAIVDYDSLPYNLQLDLAVDPITCVVQVVEFKATKRTDGMQVNTNSLRKIPLATLVEKAIRRMAIPGKLDGDVVKGSLLEFNDKPLSDDVVRRAKSRQRINSHDPKLAKLISNQAEALVRSGIKDWEHKVCKDRGKSRATLRRMLQKQKFSARKIRRDMKEETRN